MTQGDSLDAFCEKAPIWSAVAPSFTAASSDPDKAASIVVIGEECFLNECIRSGLQAALSCRVRTQRDFAMPGDCVGPINLIVAARVAFCVEEALACFEQAKRLMPEVPVIFLSAECQPSVACAMITAGAKGVISLSMGAKALIKAVRFVIAGGTFVPAECLLALSRHGSPNPATGVQAGEAVPAMTSRELVVIQAVREGKPNKVIAYEIGCSETTVKAHLRNVMRKLGVRNRTEAAIRLQQSMASSIRAPRDAPRFPGAAG